MLNIDTFSWIFFVISYAKRQIDRQDDDLCFYLITNAPKIIVILINIFAMGIIFSKFFLASKIPDNKIKDFLTKMVFYFYFS